MTDTQDQNSAEAIANRTIQNPATRRKQTAIACYHCWKSKTRCDIGRPCVRCVRLGYDDCRDRPLSSRKRQNVQREKAKTNRKKRKYVKKNDRKKKNKKHVEPLLKKRRTDKIIRVKVEAQQHQHPQNNTQPIKIENDNLFNPNAVYVNNINNIHNINTMYNQYQYDYQFNGGAVSANPQYYNHYYPALIPATTTPNITPNPTPTPIPNDCNSQQNYNITLKPYNNPININVTSLDQMQNHQSLPMMDNGMDTINIKEQPVQYDTDLEEQVQLAELRKTIEQSSPLMHVTPFFNSISETIDDLQLKQEDMSTSYMSASSHNSHSISPPIFSDGSPSSSSSTSSGISFINHSLMSIPTLQSMTGPVPVTPIPTFTPISFIKTENLY